MLIQRITGTTRVLGQRQGYLGLPVRDGAEYDEAIGQYVPRYQTAWEPTPAELEAIKEGRPIIITILGNRVAPMRVSVENENGEQI